MFLIPTPLLPGLAALVTGGCTGIGRGIVLEYLRQGCNVAANYLDIAGDGEHRTSLEQEAETMRQGTDAKCGRLVTLAGDVSKPEECALLVDQTVRHFGQLNIMVANAGVFTPASFLQSVASHHSNLS